MFFVKPLLILASVISIATAVPLTTPGFYGPGPVFRINGTILAERASRGLVLRQNMGADKFRDPFPDCHPDDPVWGFAGLPPGYCGIATLAYPGAQMASDHGAPNAKEPCTDGHGHDNMCIQQNGIMAIYNSFCDIMYIDDDFPEADDSPIAFHGYVNSPDKQDMPLFDGNGNLVVWFPDGWDQKPKMEWKGTTNGPNNFFGQVCQKGPNQDEGSYCLTKFQCVPS